MGGKAALENVSIVLHKPRFPENIGAAARAMKNMGIGRLVVVQPENCDLTRILKMATHMAVEVIEGMDVFDDLSKALAPFTFIVGTTARTGGQRPVISTPKDAAEKLAGLSQSNKVAVVFGPEDRGLTNEDIRLCHALVTIPTADFSSLNLAQSVMVMCYELFNATAPDHDGFAPRLASRFELEGMYGHLKEVLLHISFVNPDNPDYWLTNIRRFFSRLPLRAKEVRLIRGFCRQVEWYAEKRYQDGLKASGAAEETARTGQTGEPDRS